MAKPRVIPEGLKTKEVRFKNGHVVTMSRIGSDVVERVGERSEKKGINLRGANTATHNNLRFQVQVIKDAVVLWKDEDGRELREEEWLHFLQHHDSVRLALQKAGNELQDEFDAEEGFEEESDEKNSPRPSATT